MPETNQSSESFWDFLQDGLWVDGLTLFVTSLRQTAIGILFFTIALSLFADSNPAHPLRTASLFALVITLTHFFAVSFLRQAPISKGAAVFAKRLVPSTLAIALLLFSCVVIVDGATYLAGPFVHSLQLQLIELVAYAIILALVIIGATVFWLRLTFIPFLIISGIDSPLRKAWAIGKGNHGLLFANIFFLLLVLSPFFFLLKKSGLVIFESLGFVLSTGLIIALLSVLCRSFYGQYIARTLGRERRGQRR